MKLMIQVRMEWNGMENECIEIAYWMNIYGDIPSSVLEAIERALLLAK